MPEQRPSIEAPDPPISGVISLADPRAPKYLLSGFVDGPPTQPWRWTRQHATLRLPPPGSGALQLVADFYLPEDVYQPLLPLRVTFFLNDEKVDTMTCQSAGSVRYSKPVATGLIKPGVINLLRIELDKAHVSKASGERFGLVLSRAGLEPLK